MTAKDKAEELIEKMNDVAGGGIYDAKQYALIAVDEIMEQCYDYRDIDLQASYDYWKEVKQEIENI